MKPILSITVAAGLWVATCVGPAAETAEAQSITIDVIGIRLPDGTLRDGADLPRGTAGRVTINAEECDPATEIEVQYRDFPVASGAMFLDFWRGDQGVACNDTANRDPSIGMTTLCEEVFAIQGPQQQDEIVARADGVLGDQDSGTRAYFDCSEDDDGVYEFFGLAANNEGSVAPVTDFGSFILQLDQTPREAPSNVRGGAGESQVTVNWDDLGGTDVFGYNVYVDETVTDCADSSFTPGMAVPDDLVRRANTDFNSTSAALNLTNLGLELDQSTAVAVTSVDFARNESTFSEIACVTRIATAGFCDLHEEMGGECEDCAVGGSPAGRAGLGAALLLAGAGLARRRRPPRRDRRARHGESGR